MYRFQFYCLSLYHEIGKKAIEDRKKNQASIECLSIITSVKYQNQLISDMGDRFYVTYLFVFLVLELAEKDLLAKAPQSWPINGSTEIGMINIANFVHSSKVIMVKDKS